MRRMPTDWMPAAEAWQSAYDADVAEVVFGYFALQADPASRDGAFQDWFAAACEGENAPAFVTRAREVDASGCLNDVFIAYWRSAPAHKAWWARTGVGEWWDDPARAAGAVGLWREVFAVPVEQFETLFSSRHPTGAAVLGQAFGCPVREHGYWGGMRDRIAVSAARPLDGGGRELPAAPELKQSRGRRLRVQPPDELCLIRSGQNWGDSSGEELAAYVDVVQPPLTAGMAYLRDNPAGTGCLSCRFMDETAIDGAPQPRTFGLAWFLSLAHLERWAHTHPTHLSIFGSFFRMLGARNGQLDLKLWHEVVIVDSSRAAFEYVNCHPRTGMLPWCPVTETR